MVFFYQINWVYCTQECEVRRMETNFENIMAHIVASIRAAGYEPYDQLYGYLKTGDDTYITRTGDARNLIKTIERGRLQGYVDTICVEK
jgi:uncharacterized protein (UPF0297 family)